MAEADNGMRIRKQRTKVTIVLPDRLDASIVTLSPSSPARRAPHGEIHMARPQPTTGCIFSVSSATSTDGSPSSVVVAKYTVPGDATSADSVTYEGGTPNSSFRLLPIFYGTAWLTSQPTNSDVNAAIRDLLLSPYLRELDQYGFTRLELLPPVLVNAAPPATHTSDDPGTIVSSLINAGAVPPVARPPDSVIYAVFYPNGTSVTGIPACGWHYVAAGAWVVAVEFPDGGTSTAITLANIIRIFSHELVETITDPDADTPSHGWTMDREINLGREIGDACNNTDDFTAGLFVNAYWSERHKACIIPKPQVYVLVNSSVAAISETVVSSGTMTFHGHPLDIRTCLQGTYSFTNSFVAQRAHFRATAINFRSPAPAVTWKLVNAKPGSPVLSDGFSGTVLLTVDTWSDGPGTTTHANGDVPVHVDVVGDELTILADSLGVDYVNFPVLVEATVSDGVFTASAYDRELLVCQKFEWDENYKADLESCRQRLDHLILEAIQLIRHIDKGDPVRTWVDGVSPWIAGDRVTATAQAASVAAAIETEHPDLAVQLRGLASVVYQIPAPLLSTTTAVATVAAR